MRGTLELEQLLAVAPPDPDGRGAEAHPERQDRVEPPLLPLRIGALLPGLYQDDGFTQRFVSGLDPLLATVVLVLDSLEAYVDPRLAPADFVDWLASWVGEDVRGIGSLERRRGLVHESTTQVGWYGTVAGLSRLITLHTGLVPEITDSGGAVATERADTEAPGVSTFELVVRLAVDDPATFDPAPVERIVRMAKPAHVVHRIELVGA